MITVSLGKTKTLTIAKVAGLFVLAALAIAFFAVPLSAFATCGQNNQIAVSATFFLPGDQLLKVAKSPTNQVRQATVGTSNPTTVKTATPPVLAGLTSLKFVPFISGKSLLVNDSIFFGTAKDNGQTVNVFGVVINGKPVLFTQSGKQLNRNVKFTGEGTQNDPTPDNLPPGQ